MILESAVHVGASHQPSPLVGCRMPVSILMTVLCRTIRAPSK
jgi:hypothetical protein